MSTTITGGFVMTWPSRSDACTVKASSDSPSQSHALAFEIITSKRSEVVHTESELRWITPPTISLGVWLLQITITMHTMLLAARCQLHAMLLAARHVASCTPCCQLHPMSHQFEVLQSSKVLVWLCAVYSKPTPGTGAHTLSKATTCSKFSFIVFFIGAPPSYMASGHYLVHAVYSGHVWTKPTGCNREVPSYNTIETSWCSDNPNKGHLSFFSMYNQPTSLLIRPPLH